MKLVDPDGKDTIKIYLDNGTIEQTKAAGDHNILYYKDGEINDSFQIKGGNSKCRFRMFSFGHGYMEGSGKTEYLQCSNSEIGEQIFKKIASMGSSVEWDYYSRKSGEGYSGDLSSSGIMDKMIHPLGLYTSENVGFWNHYHPNNNSDSFCPSYSDQDHARKLNGARCTIFYNGRSMDYQDYIPSHKNAYISISKFRDLWNRFAR